MTPNWLYIVDTVCDIVHSKKVIPFKNVLNKVVKKVFLFNLKTLIKQDWVISYFVQRIVPFIMENTVKKHVE